MKINFSKFEKVAGLFVLVAVATFVFATVVVAVKQGWFSRKQIYTTTFSQGEGLHPGTMVQMAGLRAGTVDRVMLNDDNKIEVTVVVTAEFGRRIKTDSVARVIRPFIIGDKVVEITVGSPEAGSLPEKTALPGEDTMDIMDLLGGGKLGPYLATLDNVLKNLKVVAEAFTDPRRSKAMIAMFDEMLPTLKDMREMAQQMTKNKNLRKSMQNFAVLSEGMNEMLPQMKELSGNTAEIMKQMVKMTEDLTKILPALAEVAPKLPEASQKGVEALKEAVIVLKAMQKSFLLRGSVKDVMEEEAQKKKDEESKNRDPAGNESKEK